VPVVFEILLLLQEGLEGFEWFKSGDSFLSSGCSGSFRPIGDCVTLMLVIVAVHTKKLPIAAVRRIVVVVVILVMDRKLPRPLALELASAPAANPRKQFERPFPVTLHPELPLPAQLDHEFVLVRGHRFTLLIDMPHYSVLPIPVWTYLRAFTLRNREDPRFSSVSSEKTMRTEFTAAQPGNGDIGDPVVSED
jgi:hypothetical protein